MPTQLSLLGCPSGTFSGLAKNQHSGTSNRNLAGAEKFEDKLDIAEPFAQSKINESKFYFIDF